MENKWFLDIITTEFLGGKINIDQTLKLLNQLNVSYDYVHVQKLFKLRVQEQLLFHRKELFDVFSKSRSRLLGFQKNDKQKSGVITMEDFRAIYRSIMHRPEFHELFCTYSPNKKILTAEKLAEFLRKEQFELGAGEGRAVALINTYEPISEGTCTQL